MYRRNGIVACATVAIVVTILGGCGSSSTSGTAKPSRGFTNTTVQSHVDIRGGRIQAYTRVELSIDYACPRGADGTTAGRVLTTLVQPQPPKQATLSGAAAATCDGTTHSIAVANQGDSIKQGDVVIDLVDAYATLFQSPQNGPDVAVAQTKRAYLRLSY